MPTQKELSDLRESYLLRREAALENKVSKLGIKLYDKIFEQYLIALEQTPAGTLKYTQTNLNLIQGLDRVYSLFNQVDNIPVINGFFTDLNGITPLNVKYFNNIQKSGVRAEAVVVDAVVQKKLGIAGGQPVKGGFADKFINDKTLLKKIKKQTTQAVTKGQSFQTFRQELKATIQGTGAKESGGLQQYYRNYAYDTYQKVDRLNQDLFAKELGLRYFIWAGGLVSNSRPLCRLANGKIIDKTTYSKLKFSDLKMSLREGVGPEWNPMNDLGHYGCRHTKNYITDAVARQLQDRWLKTSALT